MLGICSPAPSVTTLQFLHISNTVLQNKCKNIFRNYCIFESRSPADRRSEAANTGKQLNMEREIYCEIYLIQYLMFIYVCINIKTLEFKVLTTRSTIAMTTIYFLNA